MSIPVGAVLGLLLGFHLVPPCQKGRTGFLAVFAPIAEIPPYVLCGLGAFPRAPERIHENLIPLGTDDPDSGILIAPAILPLGEVQEGRARPFLPNLVGSSHSCSNSSSVGSLSKGFTQWARGLNRGRLGLEGCPVACVAEGAERPELSLLPSFIPSLLLSVGSGGSGSLGLCIGAPSPQSSLTFSLTTSPRSSPHPTGQPFL